MPWKEMSPKMQKVAFLAAWRENTESMTELCRRFEISRKTGYSLVARWRAEEEGALVERSRAPRSCPHATPSAVREAVLALRRERPTWGPAKLRAWLMRKGPEQHWPAVSTIAVILSREGLVEESRRMRRRCCPVAAEPPLGPNDVWCVDYKGWFRTGDGTRCDPLTATDSFSRRIMCCVALTPPIATRQVKSIFADLFRERGMPLVIKSDNGSPFGATGLGLTQLSAWWIRLGISPRRIAPGKPQQNGAHERMHRVLKAETTRPRPAGSLVGQQHRFDEFVRVYNTERPHEALAMATPDSLYVLSPRPYPETTPAPEYDSDAVIRRVSSAGMVKWRKQQYYLSSALAGADVQLVSHEEEPMLSVIYYRELVGRIDLANRRVLGPDPGALPRTPGFTALKPNGD